MTSPHDEAFGAVIKALAEANNIPIRKAQSSINLARYGFQSTAWNEAIEAGIPADELRAARTLIYGR